MRNALYISICLFILQSCATVERNYHYVYLKKDLKFYSKTDTLSNVHAELERGVGLYVDMERIQNGYMPAKFGEVKGWVYDADYSLTPVSRISSVDTSNTNHDTDHVYRSYSPTKSTGGSVHVKGYYRKNGTYVKPHTRKAPSRRR